MVSCYQNMRYGKMRILYVTISYAYEKEKKEKWDDYFWTFFT